LTELVNFFQVMNKREYHPIPII